jgi:putative nucleotidyltransferase with HDIG domain
MSRNKPFFGTSPVTTTIPSGGSFLRALRLSVGTRASELVRRLSTPSTIALIGAVMLAALLIVILGPGAAASRDGLPDIEVGRVAERDIVADRELSYIDEAATRVRIEAEERLVLPIFVVDEKPAARAIERYRSFQDLMSDLADRKVAGETLFLSVQSQFPGLLPKEAVLALSRSPYRAQALSHAEAILRRLLDRGIAALPASGLERYNSDYVELRRLVDGKPSTEEMPAGRLVTLKTLGAAIEEEATARRIARPITAVAAGLVRSFAVENAFFDGEQSSRRLAAVRSNIDPVVRTIAKGERIVRKGTIVAEADAAKLEAARAALSRVDWGAGLGSLGLLAATVAVGLFILSKSVSGLRLRGSATMLVGAFAFVYFIAALLVARFARPGPLILGLLMPTALFTMVTAIILGQRFSVLYSFLLSLLAQSAAGIDGGLLVFCALSGVAGTFVVRSASSRIELVRAGAVLALLQGASAAILGAPGATNWGTVLALFGWGAGNGFACALLALALLPILEQALNAPTRFRLMELSDLNAPILKRLLTVAPGTYSHSVTVAHLAESACREIGADPLLARVGAYYHDIGKIEQPEYFVENQAGYNKHEELSPRLSATVIRSHVKIGTEKARALGLPEEVVSIVAQHHGNQVIAWFLDQARKAEGEVDPDDFAYPGQPPSSREAAVVMLADSVEAASRTLKKPTMSRLEDFIREIVMDKVKQGQLDRCDLTLKDLDMIRDSFTRILAGHFHSRIEYPKVGREQTR